MPVTIEAIEVNQAIQDLRLSVPLIANKATIFRVYLAATVSARTKINGVLALSEPDGSSRSLGSLAPYVTFGNDIPLPMRRLSKEGSLNFSLGPTLLKPGAYAVSVSAVEAFGTRLECANCSTFSQPFTVEPDAPFRIRLVGFRYPVKNSIAVPSSVDFDAIESWLRSAYPVGTLVSSRLIVDMPELSDTRDCTIVNGELAALRANDMGGGAIDPRTHYYGLVPDNNDLAYYMTGCANAIPEVPDPSSVASGPAGSHSS
ncbi:MAG TPA: hypothetical protein VN999_15545, partial [Thermoanaerobaculia bacterium]|nr:hypothetical protein [Thermoanaerobaculia bacterium]